MHTKLLSWAENNLTFLKALSTVTQIYNVIFNRPMKSKWTGFFTVHRTLSQQWCAITTQCLNSIDSESLSSEDPPTSYTAWCWYLCDELHHRDFLTHHLSAPLTWKWKKKTKNKNKNKRQLQPAAPICIKAPARFHPPLPPEALAGIIFSNAAPSCANQPPTGLHSVFLRLSINTLPF